MLPVGGGFCRVGLQVAYWRQVYLLLCDLPLLYLTLQDLKAAQPTELGIRGSQVALTT